MSLQFLVERNHPDYVDDSYLKDNYVDIMHAFAGVSDDQFFDESLNIVCYTVEFCSKIKYDDIVEDVQRDAILREQLLRGAKLLRQLKFDDNEAHLQSFEDAIYDYVPEHIDKKLKVN